MTELLRFKDGTTSENLGEIVAAHLAKQPRTQNTRPLDVVLAEKWLSERASDILGHDQTAQNLGIERDQVSRKLDSIRQGARLKHGSTTSMELHAERAGRLVQYYEDSLKQLTHRIDRSVALAAQGRRSVAEFHDSTPHYSEALREYKTAGL